MRAGPRAWSVGVTLRVINDCDLERVLLGEVLSVLTPRKLHCQERGLTQRVLCVCVQCVCVPNGDGLLCPTCCILGASYSLGCCGWLCVKVDGVLLLRGDSSACVSLQIVCESCLTPQVTIEKLNGLCCGFCDFA